jgi:hypothetical protein
MYICTQRYLFLKCSTCSSIFMDLTCFIDIWNRFSRFLWKIVPQYTSVLSLSLPIKPVRLPCSNITQVRNCLVSKPCMIQILRVDFLLADLDSFSFKMLNWSGWCVFIKTKFLFGGIFNMFKHIHIEVRQVLTLLIWLLHETMNNNTFCVS